MQGRKLIVVAGIPGAGKSSILDRLGHSDQATVVNVGNLMKGISDSSGARIDRDKIRYLPTAKIDRLRSLAFRKIAGMKGRVLVDTHLIIEHEGTFVPGLPMDSLGALGGIDGIIYIDAEPKELLTRRKKDKGRKREDEGLESMELQRNINLSMLALYSAHLNIPFHIIHNKEGRLEEAVASFRKALTYIDPAR
ncbi:AAA family ATPase [Candidatus Marsarchaeota archaeon]|nr:AAA family ATPase [Candidatus Marsarchaeota archaeon]MCL5099531.1 AAA family ATPase [Candidatus Marsarchaeota archaeon]